MSTPPSDAGGLHRTIPGHDAPAPLSKGAIIGVIGSVVVAVVVAAVIVCCVCKKRKRRRAARDQEPRAPASPPPVERRQAPTEPPAIRTEGAGAGAEGRNEGRQSGASEAGGVPDRSGAGTHRADQGGCPLCRSAYGVAAGELPTTVDCGHRFHQRCIRRWIAFNRCCPICNKTYADRFAWTGGSEHEQDFSPQHIGHW